MKLTDVARRLKIGFSPDLFTKETVTEVETRLKERDGKLYVTCQIRGKDVLAKPEEIVRQLWIAALLYQYSYPRQSIAVEYPITFGRDTSKRADIVVPPRNSSFLNVEFSKDQLARDRQEPRSLASRVFGFFSKRRKPNMSQSG